MLAPVFPLPFLATGFSGTAGADWVEGLTLFDKTQICFKNMLYSRRHCLKVNIR